MLMCYSQIKRETEMVTIPRNDKEICIGNKTLCFCFKVFSLSFILSVRAIVQLRSFNFILFEHIMSYI